MGGAHSCPATVPALKAWQVTGSILGYDLAHFGFAMGTLGIAVTATQSTETDVRMSPQSSVELAGQQVTFTGVIDVLGPNFVPSKVFLF